MNGLSDSLLRGFPFLKILLACLLSRGLDLWNVNNTGAQEDDIVLWFERLRVSLRLRVRTDLGSLILWEIFF